MLPTTSTWMTESGMSEQVENPCGKCGHDLSEHTRDFGIPRSQVCAHGLGTPAECLCYGWVEVVLMPAEADA